MTAVGDGTFSLRPQREKGRSGLPGLVAIRDVIPTEKWEPPFHVTRHEPLPTSPLGSSRWSRRCRSAPWIAGTSPAMTEGVTLRSDGASSLCIYKTPPRRGIMIGRTLISGFSATLRSRERMDRRAFSRTLPAEAGRLHGIGRNGQSSLALSSSPPATRRTSSSRPALSRTPCSIVLAISGLSLRN